MNRRSQEATVPGEESPLKFACALLRDAGFIGLASDIERLKPGEPFFVLRAQDITAPGLVDEWARQNTPTCSELKIERARDVAHAMRTWNGPRKDAD